MEKITLSRREASEALGLSERSIDRMVSSGILRSFKIPGFRRRMFRKEDLEEFINKSQKKFDSLAAKRT